MPVNQNRRKILTNKYLWLGILFISWMSFFDTNSFIAHLRIAKDEKKIKKELFLLKKQIIKEKKLIKKIKSDPCYIEKLARENFYMKQKKEDIFIFEVKK